MLKLLFGRRSPVVLGVELLGLGATTLCTTTQSGAGTHRVTLVLYCLVLVQYLCVRLCYLYPWYRGERRQYPCPKGNLGIEVHLLKSLVPASYILLGASLLFYLGFELLAATLGNLFLLPVVLVNFILISFHLRDQETLPINYFTHNWHLKENGHGR